MDDVYPCYWIVGNERCGLTQGHDGDHLPYVPGEYLLLPRLHPLDTLRVVIHRRCPLCGVRLSGWLCSGVERAFWLEEDGRWAEVVPECEWQFEPCWHEARQVLPWDAVGRSA